MALIKCPECEKEISDEETDYSSNKSTIEKEISEYTIDDLRLILETQQDLYSQKEIEYIRSELDRRIANRLPKELICPKCDMTNPFSNDECMFCNYKFDKSMYYDDTYYDDDTTDNDEKSHMFEYIISFIIPLIAYILGACMLSKDNEDDRQCGKTCIIIGLISSILGAIISAIAIWH